MRLRRIIASKLPSYELYGQVEANECYFGGKRKDPRDRGAAGKIAVFGLLKRCWKVYTALNLNNIMVYTHQTLTFRYLSPLNYNPN
jgi:transposase-like protein